jgi:hypothetical protein
MIQCEDYNHSYDYFIGKSLPFERSKWDAMFGLRQIYKPEITGG